MLGFLPWPILFVISFCLIAINSLVIGLFVFLVSLVKLILPFIFIKKLIGKICYYLFLLWSHNNYYIIRLCTNTKFKIRSDLTEQIKDSCIIISNHVSWADIILISMIFRSKIPITKFFLKQSLIYIPIIGLACWGVGMPFLRRYSKKQLLKNPKLKDKDIKTTKKACASLVYDKSTLVNFVEGTRYTTQKAKAVGSKYKNLMPPKVASLAIALGQIGKKLECILDTTIVYDTNEKSAFLALLKGKIPTIAVDIKKLEITDNLVGDYINDKEFKQQFTNYIRELWGQKDILIDNIKENIKS